MIDRVKAVIASNEDVSSVRQDDLSQEARDLLAFAFASGTVDEFFGLPINAVEIRIGDDDVDRIMVGGGFVKHAGCNSCKYFSHWNDPDWSIVFRHDCDGCPKRGKLVFEKFIAEKSNGIKNNETNH